MTTIATVADYTMTTNMTNATIIDEISVPQRIIIGVILLLICIAGFCGNTLVIVACFLSKKLRTTTNIYIIHLAIADLLSCLFQLWDIVGLWSLDGWPIWEGICVISATVSFTCLSFTIVDLAMIAINRYHKVLYPMQTYQMVYTWRNVHIMTAIAWVYCALVVIVPPLAGIGKLGYSFDLKTCASDETNPGAGLYTLITIGLIFPIPLVTIIFCYTKIFIFVSHHNKAFSATRRKSSMRHESVDPKKVRKPNPQTVQITKNLLYVVVAFMVCFIPYTIAVAVFPAARHWAGLLAMANSAINPVIYGLKHPHFKEVFPYIIKGEWKEIPELVSIMHRFRSERGSFKRGSRSGSKTMDTGVISETGQSHSPPPTPMSP